MFCSRLTQPIQLQDALQLSPRKIGVRGVIADNDPLAMDAPISALHMVSAQVWVAASDMPAHFVAAQPITAQHAASQLPVTCASC